MFGDNLRTGVFLCVFARSQISAPHRSSSAGLIVFEKPEGISAHFRLVGYFYVVFNRD